MRALPRPTRATSALQLKPTRTTRTGAYPDLRALQSQVGNRALTGMLGLVRTGQASVQRASDSAGWKGADSRGTDGGWNTKPKDVGSIRRIPIDGLTLGNRKDFAGTERNRTTESAAGRAIMLIPSGIRLKDPVDVLLHLHGHTDKTRHPYAGWRQHSHSGTVRDVDLDRIEAQLEAAKTTQMVAILPQGVGKSDFGDLPVDRYLDQVFTRFKEVGDPPRIPKGTMLTRGRLVLSAHSGGGDDVARMLSTPTGQTAAEVILFEGIHGAGLDIVDKWAKRHLEKVRQVVKALDPTDPARDAAVKGCPKLRAFYSTKVKGIKNSGLYADTYVKLKNSLDKWFDDHGADLGTQLPDVRARFLVQDLKGASHETVVRGLGDKPAEGPLAEALKALDTPNPHGPSSLATEGESTWVHPMDQPKVGSRRSSGSSGASPTSPVPAPTPAAPAPTPTPAPSPAPAAQTAPAPAAALTPERIIEIATKHGLGVFGVFAVMPRILRGGDSLDMLADVLVTAGMYDNVNLTDVLFDVAHPELDGGQIPADRADLKDEWVQLRRRYAKPAVARRSAPADATGTAVSPATTTGPAPVILDPATVKAAKAATGAKTLTEEQKEKLPKTVVDQARNAKKKEDSTAVINTLLYNNTDVEKWFAGIIFNATFLNVPIRESGGKVPGVHQELLDKLVLAEKTLAATFPGLSKAQIAGKMGIYDIGGLRPPKKASGGSLPSFHCFGLAIDINAATNPFVGLDKPKRKRNMTAEEEAKYQLFMQNRSPRIIERAMRLLNHEEFDIEKSMGVPKTSEQAGRQWERHRRASDALAAYLSLAADLESARLRDLVASLRQTGDTMKLEEWKARIAQDRVQIKNWDFGRHRDPEKRGYLDLGKELVQALVGAGLLWGGSYKDEKDMMHFDWRKGTISERPPDDWTPPNP